MQTGVDAIDHRLIELLRVNARSTYGAMGAAVGLSPAAVKRRVDRLETLGVVTGYTVMVDHAKLGRPLEAFAELRFVGSASVGVIEGISGEVPEIEAVFTVAGDPDALAWIRARDVEHLKSVIDRIRRTGKVNGTKTLMVLGSVRTRSLL